MTALPFYLEMKKMPFARLLLALATGIVLQWYIAVSAFVLLVIFIMAAGCYGLLFLLHFYQQFRLQWLRGVFILLMIALGGSVLCCIKNPAHQQHHYANVYQDGDAVIATVSEALLDKNKTYKANATVTSVYRNKKYLPATGTIIIYVDKKNISSSLQYGSQILFTKSIQKIKNTGNPGAFNYQRFLLFQGITAQVYLNSNDYQILQQQQGFSFQDFLNRTRNYIIKTIQTFIPDKKESGVAEALLIGYRNDLDKQLVQSYSNTGVVHIIAISGLHLGMIYGFILLLFSSFKNKRWYRFVVPVVALAVIWLFTLLAGAVPSILRSAVTFSFIALGMFINRKANIYNTLAASAFCLLLFNPFLLWDVGFQLSYAAVLSIVLFTKPLYNCLYFQNKILNRLWQLSCVNIAAQIFTLPIVLYNFHQFPLLFLINNLLIIPLSEIILFITLFLIVISKWVWLAMLAGKGTQLLLWLMNTIIEHTEKLPFSLLPNIKTDVVQALLLYIIISLLAVWLLYKLPRCFMYALWFVFIAIFYTSVDVWKVNHQHQLVVYNISHHSVIDIILERNAVCFCDSLLQDDIQANSFFIKPSRTQLGVKNCKNQPLFSNNNWLVRTSGKTVLIISKPLPILYLRDKIKVDVVIVTNNAKLFINDLQKAVDCSFIIADNNTSLQKTKRWKQLCDSLHIQFHSISQQGAFITDL